MLCLDKSMVFVQQRAGRIGKPKMVSLFFVQNLVIIHLFCQNYKRKRDGRRISQIANAIAIITDDRWRAKIKHSDVQTAMPREPEPEPHPHLHLRLLPPTPQCLTLTKSLSVVG
jgi:hypothetical protein